MSEAARAQAAKARQLVVYSQILGWGGLGALVGLTPVALGLGGGVAAGIVAALALGSTITGAVLGQVGRAMQGRVL